MNLVKLKAELAGEGMCPVLSEHILDMASQLPELGDNVNAIEGMNTIIKQFYQGPYAGYFETNRQQIIENSKIQTEHIHLVIQGLDLMAKTYFMYGLIPLVHEDIIDGFDELKKIEKAAQKLKDLLPKKYSILYTVLTMVEQAQPNPSLHFDESSNAAAQYFTNLNFMLESLIKLRPYIPQTAMGQFMKLGVKSPKGNLALRVWLEQAHALWTVDLKRNFEFDGKEGVNGRKRFTEFAYEALITIHPVMQYASVEHGVRALLERNSKLNALLPPKNIS